MFSYTSWKGGEFKMTLTLSLTFHTTIWSSEFPMDCQGKVLFAVMRVMKERVRYTDRCMAKLSFKLLFPPQFPWKQGQKQPYSVHWYFSPMIFFLPGWQLFKFKNWGFSIFHLHRGQFLKRSFSILEAYQYYLESFQKPNQSRLSGEWREYSATWYRNSGTETCFRLHD